MACLRSFDLAPFHRADLQRCRPLHPDARRTHGVPRRLWRHQWDESFSTTVVALSSYEWTQMLGKLKRPHCDLTATSLGIMVSKGNHTQMALIQVSEIFNWLMVWIFSRMRSKGSRFTLGVWGLRVCSLDVAFASATVRNRSQPSATVRTNSVWPCLWEVLQRWSFLEVADASLLRFAWQAWHFVTFRRVLQRVESRFAWQARYFCDVFRRCVAVFVAGAALWTCPSSFFVAGAAL